MGSIVPDNEQASDCIIWIFEPDLEKGVLYDAAEEVSREVKHVEGVEREDGRLTLVVRVEGLYE